MANRQRDFLMAANHYRAGRITIDEFKQKVLAAMATQGDVAVLFDPQGDAEDLEGVNEAIAAIETEGGSVEKIEVALSAMTLPKSAEKSLRSTCAVVMIGLADTATVNLVTKEAGCLVFVVLSKDCQADALMRLAQELPASAVLVGKGQAASAAKMAASISRP